MKVIVELMNCSEPPARSAPGVISVFGVLFLASDVYDDFVDPEPVAATAADVVPELGGVSVDEVLANIGGWESVSLSVGWSLDSVVLDILSCGIAITDESDHEGTLLVAPALILPVDDNIDGWFAVECLPWSGGQVVCSHPVVKIACCCSVSVGVSLGEPL